MRDRRRLASGFMRREHDGGIFWEVYVSSFEISGYEFLELLEERFFVFGCGQVLQQAEFYDFGVLGGQVGSEKG